MCFQPQAPADDVELVNSLVADLAVTVVLQKPPAADGQLVVRLHRRGADPLVPIHARRSGLGLAAPAGASLEGDTAGHIDAADRAGLELLDPFANLRAGAALRAMLHDPLVLPGGVDHLPPFEDVVRAGLLDIH